MTPNLFVSALLRGTIPASILAAWRDDKFVLVTSEELLAELFEVLARPKFQSYFSPQTIAELGYLIFERAHVTTPATHIQLCRDPKDDMLLDAAIAGEAQFLVTGDKDLRDDSTLNRVMQNQYQVRVVSATEFLAVLTPQD